MITAYGWTNAFPHASRNLAIPANEDWNNVHGITWWNSDDTQARLEGHGICLGITLSWIVSLLNGVEESFDTEKFADYFNQVLRFQGAFIQDYDPPNLAVADPVGYIQRMIQLKFNPGIKVIKRIKFSTISPSAFVNYNWAAFVVLWGHVVGFGRRSGNYYIMDPNYGLFQYDTFASFLTDGREFIEARRRYKQKNANEVFDLTLFGKA